MMNRLENAARQALEALENHPGNYKLSKAECVKYNAVEAALREALAEQQAAEPNAVLVEGFSQVALRKLNDLREKGYAINGVAIATSSPDGKTEHGAVTTGGMVLWWPQQQAAKPVAWQAEHQSGEWVIRETPTLPSTGIFTGRTRALYTHPAPTQQPLTDEQKAVLRECRNKAMKWAAQAGIPECAAFGEVAQDLDWLCGQLGITAPQLEAAQTLIDQQAAKALSREGGAA